MAIYVFSSRGSEDIFKTDTYKCLFANSVTDIVWIYCQINVIEGVRILLAWHQSTGAQFMSKVASYELKGCLTIESFSPFLLQTTWT